MKIPIITAENLSPLKHGFFTRKGGVSKGIYHSLNVSFRRDPSIHGEKDADENVLENRMRALKSLHLSETNLQTISQKHTALAWDLEQPWTLSTQPVADAIVTTRQDVTLGIQTADCVPILLADLTHKVIGIIHAGWRGAFSGIIQNTVALFEKKGAHPSQIRAAIGPCIHQDSYEVSPAFRDDFLKQSDDNEVFFKEQLFPEKIFFNLPGYVTALLEHAGVKNIENLPYDTYENEDLFFSCRRAFHKKKKGFGGNLSLISLANSSYD